MQFVLNTEAANFACARQELALSLAQLADYLNVKRHTVMAWECGSQPVPSDIWQSFKDLRNSPDLVAQLRASSMSSAA